MSETPKKPLITGIDFSWLTKARPTRVPSALSTRVIRKQTTHYRRIAIDAGILFLIILIAYGASVLGRFVFSDHYIDYFLAIKISEDSFWSNVIIRAISQPLSQPWIISSFAWDVLNFGLDTEWFHVINIIFHFLSCFYFYILVYGLARHFWQDDGREEPVHEVALLAAAILACHPLGTESVAHITGRVATLTACNFFLTLSFFSWAFLAGKIKTMLIRYILAFVFLLQALFCDVQALAIPAVMLLLAGLFKPAEKTTSSWLKEKWGEILLIVLLIILMPVIALPGFAANLSNGFVLPLQSWQIYVASQFRALITYYLRCFVLPVGLSIFPPYTTASGFTDPFFMLGCLILCLGGCAVYFLRKLPLAAFGLGLAILSYLPPIFFVQNEIVADRRFYLAIAGLSLMIASLARPLFFKWRGNNRLRIIALLIVAALSTITILRALAFRSDLTLFKAATKVNSGDPWAKGMLAWALIDNHHADQSIDMAHQALAINNNCQPAHFALGKASLPFQKKMPQAEKEYKVAETEFEQALSLAKSQHLGAVMIFECQRELASVLVELGEYKRARVMAEQALIINPNSIKLNLIMGKSLNGLGQYLKALTYLNRGFERDHTNPDYMEPIAECALGIGTPTLLNVAYNVSKRAIPVIPTHKLRIFLAQSALATGHLNESLQWSQVAYNENPYDARAVYVRSFALRAAGRGNEAKILESIALRLDPEIKKKMPIVIANKEKTAIVPLQELYPRAR